MIPLGLLFLSPSILLLSSCPLEEMWVQCPLVAGTGCPSTADLVTWPALCAASPRTLRGVEHSPNSPVQLSDPGQALGVLGLTEIHPIMALSTGFPLELDDFLPWDQCPSGYQPKLWGAL